MPLAHEDLRSLFTGGAATTSNSPVEAMKKTADSVQALLAETSASNKAIITLLKDQIKALKGGRGNNGYGLLESLTTKMYSAILKKMGPLFRGGKALIGGAISGSMRFGKFVLKGGGDLAAVLGKFVAGGIETASLAIKSGGRMLASKLGATVSGFMSKAVGSVGKLFTSLLSGAGEMLGKAGSVIGKAGGFLGKAGGILGKGLPFLKGAGRLLGKAFLPLTAVFAFADGAKGWANADSILGRKAGLGGKIAATVGTAISGLTFGLTDTISQWFGFGNFSQVLDGAGQAVVGWFSDLGTTISDGFSAGFDWLKSKISNIDMGAMFSGAGKVVLGIVTAPYEMLKALWDDPAKLLGDSAAMVADFGKKIYDTVAGGFGALADYIVEGVKHLFNSASVDNLTPAQQKRVFGSRGAGGAAAAVKGASAPVASVVAGSAAGGGGGGVPSVTIAHKIDNSAIGLSKADFYQTILDATTQGQLAADKERIRLMKSSVTPSPAGGYAGGGYGGVGGVGGYAGGGYAGGGLVGGGGYPSTSNGNPDGSASPASDASVYTPMNLAPDHAAPGVILKQIAAIKRTGGIGAIKGDGGKGQYAGRQQRVAQHLLDAGVDPKMVAAMVGNMANEGLHTNLHDTRWDVKQVAQGLEQWGGDRQENLTAFSKPLLAQGMDIEKVQSLFAKEEMDPKSPYRHAGAVKLAQALKDNPNMSVEELTARFKSEVELPATGDTTTPARIDSARKVYDAMGKGAASPEQRIVTGSQTDAAIAAGMAAKSANPATANSPATAGAVNPTSLTLGDHSYLDQHNPNGAKLEGISPKFLANENETMRKFNEMHKGEFAAEVFGPSSGIRTGKNINNHGADATAEGGAALDIRIRNLKTGELLENKGRGGADNAGIYQDYANTGKAVQNQFYKDDPDMAGYRFGGYFSKRSKVPADFMHRDVTGRTAITGGGDWVHGYSREQMQYLGMDPSQNHPMGNIDAFTKRLYPDSPATPVAPSVQGPTPSPSISAIVPPPSAVQGAANVGSGKSGTSFPSLSLRDIAPLDELQSILFNSSALA
jgi:Phage tail lysozyme